jgi:SAM-dependent methyltransferase
VLFDEEVELLGPLAGRRLAHLQCNAGQDTLCLARRGANALGVDLSDEAIRFARELSEASRIPARFERAELLDWLATTPERFDLAFSSYGAVGWIPALDRWAKGIARILAPGGVFAYVEFHPLVWSFDPSPPFGLGGDDYFARDPFWEPVGDYVAESGAALMGGDGAAPGSNDIAAPSWQHGLGEIISALAGAGFHLEVVREWPYANGCRLRPGLVPLKGRRWTWPEGVARVPLMFGVRARLG